MMRRNARRSLFVYAFTRCPSHKDTNDDGARIIRYDSRGNARHPKRKARPIVEDDNGLTFRWRSSVLVDGLSIVYVLAPVGSCRSSAVCRRRPMGLRRVTILDEITERYMDELLEWESSIHRES